MANTLKIKRGTAATIPQGQLAEPLFTSDTYDLYIGKGGALGNQRFQKYITSGTSTDFIKGDGTLDGTTYQATSEKGQNNGYASLDAGGKVPAAQLPNSVMEYKGTWNASTNNPTLADGTGNAGDVYIVSVGGTQNLGSGSITFEVGDWVMYNGAIWQKSTSSNAVVSVNGQTGVVTITFDQLSPMTTLGDLIYGGASGAGTRLAGNITTTKKFLSQTGNATISAAPSWETVTKSDVGLGNVENTALSTWAGSTNITTLGTITAGTWNGTTIAIANGGTGQTTKGDAFNALSPMTTLGDIIYGGASGAGTRLAGNTAASKRFLIQTGDGTNSAAPSWGSIAAGDVPTLNQNTTGSAATLTTARTFTIGSTGKTFDGSANVSWTLAEIGAQAALTDPVTGTGAANRIAYWSSASAITGSATFTFTPTSALLVNNSVTAASAIARGINFTPTLVAAANNDVLVGLDINPTFTNGSFTGVSNIALRVTGNATITGTITGTLSGNATTASAWATARTLTIGSTGKSVDGSGNVSWTLAEIGAAAALSGTSGRVAYWNSGTTIAADDSLLFSPTSTFRINNVITAAAGGASSFNLISTINAAANNDILYGVNINPTFNNGAFTGVTQRALGVFGNVYINGTITSGAWNGSVIGSSYGGAGTVNGILKANGSGTVSAAVAGTDYVIPSALNSYLPLAGGTLTGALIGTTYATGASGYYELGYGANASSRSWRIKNDELDPGDLNIMQSTTRTGTTYSTKFLIKPTGAVSFGSGSGLMLEVSGNADISGSTTSARFIPSGTTIATVGMYSSAANTLDFSTNSVNRISISSTGTTTLTGALSGTSATFSGNVDLNGGELNINYDKAIRWKNSGGTLRQILAYADDLYIDSRDGGINFRTGTAGSATTRLTISSTGAATFSSSVQSSNLLVNTSTNDGYVSVNGNNSSRVFYGQGGATFPSGNSLFRLDAGGNVAFQILGSGAATFSSSVTAGGYLANGTTTITSPIDTLTTKAYFDASGISGAALTLRADSIGRTLRLTNDGSGTVIGAIDTNSNGLLLATNTNHPIIFNTYTTERMRITSGGNVGIGTTSPSEKLQVAGNVIIGGTAAYNSVLIHNSGATGGGGILTYQNNVAQGFFGALGWYEGNTNTGAVIGTDSASRPIVFYTSSERMRITGGGNVGIGTASPSVLLHLNGSNVANRGQLTIQAGDFSQISFYKGATTTTDLVGHIYTVNTGNFDMNILNYTSTGALIFGTNGSTERMRITSGGQIEYTAFAPKVTSATIAATGTQTPTLNTSDTYIYTGSATSAYTLTIANPTGSPTQGQKMIIRIKDNGTQVMTLSFGSQYRGSTDITLPTATTAGKFLYLGFIYNSTDTKWDLIAKVNNI